MDQATLPLLKPDLLEKPGTVLHVYLNLIIEKVL